MWEEWQLWKAISESCRDHPQWLGTRTHGAPKHQPQVIGWVCRGLYTGTSGPVSVMRGGWAVTGLTWWDAIGRALLTWGSSQNVWPDPGEPTETLFSVQDSQKEEEDRVKPGREGQAERRLIGKMKLDLIFRKEVLLFSPNLPWLYLVELNISLTMWTCKYKIVWVCVNTSVCERVWGLI